MSTHDILQTSRQARDNRIWGVVIGLVTNNQDPEGMGRVRVTFPWRGEGDESYWARIASLMAGNDRGTFFLPEVGDEVLVAFDHGDISHPYVLGALWNGQDVPPETNSDGQNNIRMIKSRSGHVIRLDDTQAQEKVEIQTKAGHRILLDDSSGQEKIEIVDKTGSNSIKIDSVANNVSIESTMQLKIKAAMIEIESTGMMTIKSSGTLTLKGAIVQIN